jgi:D-sedoheptulose 7-phosphate isomerase
MGAGRPVGSDIVSLREHGEQIDVAANRIIAAYLESFGRLVAGVDCEAVVRVVDLLRSARDAGQAVYVAGNGGSAATASHFVNDLGKATRQSGGAPFRALCLSDNISWLTALANDEGYERAFAGQLENFASPGDVLVVISASGNSPNVVAAVELARERGVRSVGLLGFDGGRLKDLVDEAVWVETESGQYGPVETMHTLICDLVTSCLTEG